MIRVNGIGHEVEPLSVKELLETLRIQPRGIAVALNGEIVRRSDWTSTVVQSGSSIEIVTAAAGG